MNQKNKKSIIIIVIGIITACITSFLLGLSYQNTLVNQESKIDSVKSQTAEEFIKEVFKENRTSK